MRCTRCGGEVPESSKFCAHCGAPAPSAGSPGKGVPVWAVAVSAVIVLSLLGVAVKSLGLLDRLPSLGGGSSAPVGAQSEAGPEAAPEAESEPEPEPETELATTGTTPFWGVWIGAFSYPENAEERMAEARANGLPEPRLEFSSDWSNLNQDGYYVVSVGSYQSSAEAEAVLEQARQYYADAYVKHSGDYQG